MPTTDLPSPFIMNILIGIADTNPSATLYFKVSIVSPPAAYSVSSTNLGSLAVGASAIFTFTPVRALPTLTAGEYDETLTFRVDSYTDSGYSAAYTNQTLSVTIHHFNHTDGSWTATAHDTFEMEEPMVGQLLEVMSRQEHMPFSQSDKPLSDFYPRVI